MRCFYHQDQDAVGSCKVCGKGLCTACGVDLDHGLACRNKHEQRAIAVEQLTSRAMQGQSVAGGARYVLPAFTGLMGLFFTGYGYFWAKGDHFVLILGIGFIAFSLALLVTSRRPPKSKRSGA